jgi:hypothetical protein
VLDVACVGDPLAPSASRSPFGEEEYRKGIPADGALLDVDFDALR